MGSTACTDPQCLYKGELYFYFTFFTWLGRILVLNICILLHVLKAGRWTNAKGLIISKVFGLFAL